MDAIVAVTKNWGIGKDNSLLLSIPDDMKFFRETTRGAVVIMGRKTLESFPNKKPLPGRISIVMSTNPEYTVEGAIVVKDELEAIREAAKHPERRTFVIGGESVYRRLLDYSGGAYVTKMDIRMEADTFFPNLDELENWEVEDEGEPLEHEGIGYRFVRYKNNRVKVL